MVTTECFCCGKKLAVEFLNDDPFPISPVYDGLIFRASGNFGSTIFDPMPIGVEEYLQVIICDDCIKRNTQRVTRIHNIKRKITSDSSEFGAQL